MSVHFRGNRARDRCDRSPASATRPTPSLASAATGVSFQESNLFIDVLCIQCRGVAPTAANTRLKKKEMELERRLQGLLIVSGSGLVLYSRCWDERVHQPRMLGSLVRTIVEAAVSRTGLVPRSFRMERSVLSLSVEKDARLVGAVLVGPGDVPGITSFGEAVASAAAVQFVAAFGDRMNRGGHHLSQFDPFHAQIGSVLFAARDAVHRKCAYYWVGGSLRYTSLSCNGVTRVCGAFSCSAIARECVGLLPHTSFTYRDIRCASLGD